MNLFPLPLFLEVSPLEKPTNITFCLFGETVPFLVALWYYLLPIDIIGQFCVISVFLFNYFSTVFIILIYMYIFVVGIYYAACPVGFMHVLIMRTMLINLHITTYKIVILSFIISSQFSLRRLCTAIDQVSVVGGISARCAFPARGGAIINQLLFCPGCVSPLGCVHQCRFLPAAFPITSGRLTRRACVVSTLVHAVSWRHIFLAEVTTVVGDFRLLERRGSHTRHALGAPSPMAASTHEQTIKGNYINYRMQARLLGDHPASCFWMVGHMYLSSWLSKYTHRSLPLSTLTLLLNYQHIISCNNLNQWSLLIS